MGHGPFTFTGIALPPPTLHTQASDALPFYCRRKNSLSVESAIGKGVNEGRVVWPWMIATEKR